MSQTKPIKCPNCGKKIDEMEVGEDIYYAEKELARAFVCYDGKYILKTVALLHKCA